MPETVDSVIATSPPPRVIAVADALVHHGVGLGHTGASPADILAGFLLASARIREWVGHGDWRRLRDNK